MRERRWLLPLFWGRSISNLGLSECSLGGHPERRAKPEVEGSLVSKGDPSTPPRCGSAQDDCSIRTVKLRFDFLYPSFSVRIFRTKTLTNALCCAMMETKRVSSIMGVWLLLIPTEDTVFIEPVTGLDEEEPIQVVHRRALFFSPKPLTIHPKRGIIKSGVFCSQPC